MEKLNQIRKNSEADFLRLPLPKAKDENFRYFPWSDSLALKAEVPTASAQGPLPIIGLQSDELACLEISSAQAKAAGDFRNGTMLSLSAALAKEGSILADALVLSKKLSEDKFAQLASSRWTNGAYVRWNPGTNSQALRVHLHADQSWTSWRNLLQAEAGSEGIYIHEITAADTSECIDLSTVTLAEHSKLHLILVVRAQEQSKVIQRLHFTLGKNSFLKVTPVFLGAGAVQCRMTVDLAASGAELVVQAAVRAQRQEICDFWFEVDHHASHTKSSAEFLSVLDGKSKAIFNGLIHVHKNALHCEAVQKSKALLMSDKAQALAHPKLIIQTDEVKCAHGASVSTVNPDQIYYLESRGIPRPEATRMIVEGFIEPVLQQIPVESLYQRIEGYLGQRSTEVEQ